MSVAPLILLLRYLCPPLNRHEGYWKMFVFMLTFVFYASSHAARRPFAVVKNVLNEVCNRTNSSSTFLMNETDVQTSIGDCGWKPFDTRTANDLFSVVDSSFLFCYALFIYVSGPIAERSNIRVFISCGSCLTGVFTILLGVAYYADIHALAYFIAMQALCGIAQSTAWPSVVAVVGNWFGQHRKGLIFGIWNSHLYIGNVLGVVLAGYMVQIDWGLSFVVPGCIMLAVGTIMFLMLPASPTDVGFQEKDFHPGISSDMVALPSNATSEDMSKQLQSTSQTAIQSEQRYPMKRKAIQFTEALHVPGVPNFAFALFFTKFTSYIFMYWLPRYEEYVFNKGAKASAYASAFFDLGGILGGVIAGVILDFTGSGATTCAGFLICACPTLFCFKQFGGMSIYHNVLLQILCGALVDGPYGMITAAVSTELGMRETLTKNVDAMATVSAIIDGTGSIGAALGPLIAGPVATYSWQYLFYTMMVAELASLLCIAPLACKELRRISNC